MLRVCQEVWNRGFDTRIQTVNQRVLGCKLCIISNRLPVHSLLPLYFFPIPSRFFFSFFSPANLGRKCRANLQRGTVECCRHTVNDDCYSQTNFTVAWKLHFSINQLCRDKSSTSKFKMLSVLVFLLPLQFLS